MSQEVICKDTGPSLILILVVNIAIIIVFAFIYSSMGTSENFNGVEDGESFGFTTAMYFSATTQSTVGYGDISPKSNKAKIIVMIHQMIVILEIAGLAAGSFNPSNMPKIKMPKMKLKKLDDDF